MATTQQAMDAVFAMLDSGKPMHVTLRDNERAAGHEVVVPGDVPWLSADDWDATICVSTSGREVRLVAILAKHPGNGAFRRAVRGIIAAGLMPVIVEPTHEMRATMKRWKWTPRVVGSGFMDREEQWRPRKSFSI